MSRWVLHTDKGILIVHAPTAAEAVKAAEAEGYHVRLCIEVPDDHHTG